MQAAGWVNMNNYIDNLNTTNNNANVASQNALF